MARQYRKYGFILENYYMNKQDGVQKNKKE